MRRDPTEQELHSYYDDYGYTSIEFISPITIAAYHRLLDEFEPLRKTGNLLDVGCGAGAFLIEAGKRGWNVHGTEYSKNAVKLCQEQGITMKEGALDRAQFEGIEFDVITSFEVLEHLNEFHEELGHVKGLLRKGGLFYCTTPNWNALQRFKLKADYNIIFLIFF